VFAAGTRTVRYRLNDAYTEDTLDILFNAIRQTLSWIDAHPMQSPPAWENLAPPSKAPVDSTAYRIREHRDSAQRDTILQAIVDLEARVYEPARRDPIDRLQLAFDDPDGIVLIAEHHGDEGTTLVGYALAAPLEHFSSVPGVSEDPTHGHHLSLYSMAISVDPAHRGHGLGRRLKREQINAARAKRHADGRPRFLMITGRNRVGHTHAMRRLNRSFGGHRVAILDHQYGEADAQAVYYRIPVHSLAPCTPRVHDARTQHNDVLDLADGITRPLATPPQSLLEAERKGLLWGPTINKLTVCNYVTPAIVRAVEWVTALTPELPHLYMTSSRDETLDKSLRTLRYYRAHAHLAIGFEGGYVGHTTAAARSLSDPNVHQQGPAYFNWPRVAHPARVGSAATLQALQALVDEHGAEALIGLVIETVQERRGDRIPDDFWPLLETWRANTGVPVVVVENASAAYRSGRGVFGVQHTGFVPNVMTWWGGGQVGFVHVDATYFIPKPLMMISTWDGDEISLIRVHHQLRALRSLDLAPTISAWDKAMDALNTRAFTVRGLGLYRVIEASDAVPQLAAALAQAKLRVRHLPGGHLALSPPLDRALEAAARLHAAIDTLS